jgi:succinate dehydrogenase / fumarate reductase flavoprotein subunit
MPGIHATDPAEKRREAEVWCDRFEASTRRWLKSTVAKCGPEGEPEISYQDVDTSLMPPRPRLYGLVGGEEIEEVWKQRQRVAGAGGEAQKGSPAYAGAPS